MKRFLPPVSILLSWLLFVQPLFAAVAFDASSSGQVAGGPSLTVSHVTAGDFLACALASGNALDLVTGGTITYNGVPMTKSATLDSGSNWLWIYTLVAPATGTHNLVVTPTSNAFIEAICHSFSGVNPSAPVGTVIQDCVAGSGASCNVFQNSPMSQSISMAGGSFAFDAIALVDGGAISALTPGGGQSEPAANLTDGAGVQRLGASYQSGASAMSWTWTASFPANVGQAIIEIKAAGAAGAVRRRGISQ